MRPSSVPEDPVCLAQGKTELLSENWKTSYKDISYIVPNVTKDVLHLLLDLLVMSAFNVVV